MKRSILISAILILMAAVSFAQTECTANDALFKFDNAGMAKEVRRLGMNPEFPFLRNLSSPAQVYSAIMRNAKKSNDGAEHFNDLMMAIGLTNGTSDLTESDITAFYIPPGTEGNMGSGNYTSAYCRLMGDPDYFKAWKISSGTGCYVYILAKCGNAFYPKGAKTACITAPVEFVGDMKEVTLSSSGQKVTTNDNTYVYFERRKHKHQAPNPLPGTSDPYPSTPLMLRTTSGVEVLPDSYKVTVTTPDNSIRVCPDSTVDITANINVEKTSAYTGYYPSDTKKEYKKVTRREYKIAARKLRKAERKERKIARRTGIKVSVSA